MLHYQHSHESFFSRSMLRRDFISLLPKRGLDHVVENILSYLDAKSLCAAELVCKEWYQVISEGKLWKTLIERRVRTDSLWRGLIARRGWIKYLFKPSPGETHPDGTFYRRLYPKIIHEFDNIEKNWLCGWHTLQRIDFQKNDGYVFTCCVQFDDHKIVSGLSDGTIRISDRNTLECIQVLRGSPGAVEFLQFDDRVVISGSIGSTVRVWDVKTGELINTVIHDNVCGLRFNNSMMVTCSGDGSIAVWNMVSPSEITVQRVLVGHTDAVIAVDFDDKYIVSASLDDTIMVWNTTTCELVRTLVGHKGSVQCIQYRDRLVVSGSWDCTIKLWDIESGACLRTLEGHNDLVECIQFDNKRIVSGAFDGEIKVWDLAAALDPSAPAGTLCLLTSVEHSDGVSSLQLDDFQIVSSSCDDTILIFDFLNVTRPETSAMSTPITK